MPYLVINGARLYFETLGTPAAGRSPLVLIHGATSTGHNDWGGVAPRLAAEGWHVIVPDCRGHGRSENPHGSYRFAEMAADTAAVVAALGYPRAHVIGHSNGGNVALVLLMEHPAVVDSAVLQAANAYVSPDLREREPRVFDPARMEREDPDWRDEMVALHGPTHGSDYWRELLGLTVREILSGPNYMPADLAGARRPVLVIQGERDDVNAPARHAQFLAEHLPGAECWLPAGAGHTVHRELEAEWVARVLGFIDRVSQTA